MKIMRKLASAGIALACAAAFSSMGASAALAATPFKASVGSTNMNLITETADGYTAIDYPAPDYIPTPRPATLFTVAIPASATKVRLTYNGEMRLAYNYDASGNCISSLYDGDAMFMGESFSRVSVDAAPAGGAADGIMDFIQVQNPYNYDPATGVYSGGELLYAVTFKAYDAVTTNIAYSIGELGAEVAQVSTSAKTITIPKTIKKMSVNSIAPKVFSSATATKVVVKSTTLTRNNVKNCFKGSSVKTVVVPSAKLSAYKKIFTKANCGKSVKVTK